jgi:hypothetical protein
LFSTRDIASVASHLTHWLNGVLLEEDGSKLGDVLVRHYDARVLPGFISMLNPAQHNEFMQPFEAIGLWTRSGTWETWLPSQRKQSLPGAVPSYTLEQQATLSSLTRTDKLHAMLDEHYGPNAQASEMGNAIAERYLAMPQDERYRTLHRLRDRAESQGVAEEPDLFLFASLALGIHPQFDQQPQFAEAIATAVARKYRLGDVLAELPETAWQTLDTFSPAQI